MGDLREELEKAFKETDDETEVSTDATSDNSDDEADDAGQTGDEVDQSGEKTAAEEPEKEPETDTKDSQPEIEDAAGEEKPEKDPEPDSEVKDTDIGAAPQSWSPAVREHWKDVPTEVREVVMRREQEITTKMNEVNNEVRVAREFMEIAKPYEGLMAAQNSTPMQSVKNLFQTAGRLTVGTPKAKAETIAEIIQTYNVDISALDDVLSGSVSADPQAQQLASMLDQRLAPIQQFIGQQQQAAQNQFASSQHEVNASIESFYGNPKNEFVKDVAPIMADLLDSASAQGKTLTLEDAYNNACYANPEIRSIVMAREKAASAQQNQNEIRKKKKAAASISGSPGGMTSQMKGAGMRGDLENAWNDVAEG